MRYLLDTNVLSEILRKHPDRGVVVRLEGAPANAVATSAICVAELRHGAARLPAGDRLWKRIAKEILPRLTVLPLGEAEAIRAGDLLADLERRGEPIGMEDVLIAATAMEGGFTVVTRNARHFSRIAGLGVESWWV